MADSHSPSTPPPVDDRDAREHLADILARARLVLPAEGSLAAWYATRSRRMASQRRIGDLDKEGRL